MRQDFGDDLFICLFEHLLVLLHHPMILSGHVGAKILPELREFPGPSGRKNVHVRALLRGGNLDLLLDPF